MNRKPISQVKLSIAGAAACCLVACLVFTFLHARPTGPSYTSSAERITFGRLAIEIARAEQFAEAPEMMATVVD